MILFLWAPTGNKAAFISNKVSNLSRNPCSPVKVPLNSDTSGTFMSFDTCMLSEKGLNVRLVVGRTGTSISPSSLESDSLLLFFKLELP